MSRLYFCFIYILIVSYLGISILVSAPAYSQTEHNRFDTGVVATINKLGDCRADQVESTQNGRWVSDKNGTNAARLTPPPSITVICDRPDRELKVAINVHGQRMTQNGIEYLRDPKRYFTGAQESVTDTNRYYDTAFTHEIPAVYGFGRYEIMLLTRDRDCEGWVLTVNGVQVTGENRPDLFTPVFIQFDVTSPFISIEYAPVGGCFMDISAVEVYKINE